MFNYNHLYYFYVTARFGGVSNAAKFLRISQPSLSTQIKTFESSIDRKLFEKNGRKMQLTSEGEQVLAYCRQVFSAAENLSDYLKSPEQKDKQRLRIGVSEQVERPFIADLLGSILQQGKSHFNSVLTVTSGSDQQLIEMLHGQEIDLILNNKPIPGDDLTELISLRMPVGLLVSKVLLKRHGFKRKPTLQEIFKNNKIGLLQPSEKMRLRHEVDVFMQQKNLNKPVLLESDILSVVARAVVDGAGCAFLPVPYIFNEMKLNLLTCIGPEEGYWRHRLHLFCKKQIRYNPLFDEIKTNLLLLNKVV